MSTTENELLKLGSDSINDVINSIDPNIIAITNSNQTLISGDVSLKIDKAFSIQLKTSGIPINARGSGYKRNILFSLFTKKQYTNTIIAIDEIENSFSINSIKDLIIKLGKLFTQVLLTTHSKTVLEIRQNFIVYPIFSENVLSLNELLLSLDKTDQKFFYW